MIVAIVLGNKLMIADFLQRLFLLLKVLLDLVHLCGQLAVALAQVLDDGILVFERWHRPDTLTPDV
jgi:hypothetical protein